MYFRNEKVYFDYSKIVLYGIYLCFLLLRSCGKMTFLHVLRGWLEVHTTERYPMQQTNCILKKNIGYFSIFAMHPESMLLVSKNLSSGNSKRLIHQLRDGTCRKVRVSHCFEGAEVNFSSILSFENSVISSSLLLSFI